MAKAPQEPTVEKNKITETLPDGTTRPVAWLPKLLEVLTPFFRDTASALGGQLTIRENFASRVFDGPKRIRITQPDDITPLGLFYDTDTLRPVYVLVVAEPVPGGGYVTDNFIQPVVEWLPGSQDGKAGVKLVRLQGLEPGRRYDLAVTVLGG